MGKTRGQCTYAALSGGVDSAVAAALLKSRGYDVRGIFLREYDLSLPSVFGDVIECTQEGDRKSALAVAASLDIPFEEWDFRRAYHRAVISYLVHEYKKGRTPNPDIMCNSVIKFGLFMERALREGAHAIATGHYARIVRHLERTRNCVKLLQARDTNKDQTYFLSRLTQEQLRHCLFPIGGMMKSEVRRRAKEFGLPNWNRKDSQGICFIGKLSMRDFLKTAISHKKGSLVTRDGERIGTHEGAAFFTIGQRHGLGFAGGKQPYYVVDKDMKKNIVIVDHEQPSSALYRRELVCSSLNWISGKTPKLPFTCTARIRYRQPLQKAILTLFRAHSTRLAHLGQAPRGIPWVAKDTGSLDKLGMTERLIVTFLTPQRAITQGQSVVFYRGQECLGGGIID